MRASERSWMYQTRPKRRLVTEVFAKGVDDFLQFAKRQTIYQETMTIRCPCKKCKNMNLLDIEGVRFHLYKDGFVDDYHVWVCHGETNPNEGTSGSGFGSAEVNRFHNMVMDGLGGWEDSGDEQGDSDEEEDPNTESKKFFDMLSVAQEPLYEGSNVSLLEMASRIINLKCEYNLPNRCVDGIASLLNDVIPNKNVMTRTFYDTKKVLKALQLPVERIHTCHNGCMLFWKGDASNLDECTKCGSSRWRVTSRGCRIPRKELLYFPITPRLQCLYASQSTAELMRWHAKNPCSSSKMAHPSDTEAWRHLDSMFPDFASEERNVRLGLCTDGFTPYGKFGGSYSCWPVILTPYNLPPWLCMKRQFMFLSLIIPGPKNPKANLHVYLQPLIEELKHLWSTGTLTYDVSSKKNFMLRAAVLWTISDFPAYGMLSKWPTSGKFASPVCMHRNKAFWLESGHKVSWFDCHRLFLPMDHPFRRNKTSFVKNKVDFRTPPSVLTGDEIMQQCGSSRVTQSIFWELPYWSKLLVRHNLDVMHIEKNFFDQLMNTIMDVKGRTSDTPAARRDIGLYCKRHELELIVDDQGREVSPKAPYVLDKAQRKLSCEWVKTLKFPDGYASDFARCVDSKEFKLFGMKSHDCHVFMERLLPVAFKHLLPDNVWKACTEISLFFRDLCSSTIEYDDMVRLEEQVPEIICKLERIFPPSFFNSMEHLPVHLPFEAKVAGPVQYRWMYPFERFLNHLKKKVGNKARVEGSICNAYLLEEISNFCTHYFGEEIDTKIRDLPRNVVPNDLDGDSHIPELFRNNGGRSITNGKRKFLEDKEYRRIHLYILINCGILTEYERKFEHSMLQLHPGMNHEEVWFKFEEFFPKWFRDYVIDNCVEDDVIRAMAMGPSREVLSFRQYYINGFAFHTYEYGKNKSTMNYGVSVSGVDGAEYHGILEDVIEICYSGSKQLYKTILFSCKWMDPVKGTNVHPNYKLVEVNHARKYPKYDPFVLAHQVHQIYFASYPSMKREHAQWWAVFKTKARSVVTSQREPSFFQEDVGADPLTLSIPESLEEDEDEDDSSDEVFAVTDVNNPYLGAEEEISDEEPLDEGVINEGLFESDSNEDEEDFGFEGPDSEEADI